MKGDSDFFFSSQFHEASIWYNLEGRNEKELPGLTWQSHIGARSGRGRPPRTVYEKPEEGSNSFFS